MVDYYTLIKHAEHAVVFREENNPGSLNGLLVVECDSCDQVIFTVEDSDD